MDELRTINTKIAVKQIGRFVGGIGTVILGTVLFGRFAYQLGVTDCQENLSDEFPEEWAAITEKIVKVLEKH